MKCNHCQMCHLNPVFTDDSLTKFYNGNNTAQSEAVQNESGFYNRIYSKGLNAIKKFISSGAILDIGCSTGYFFDLAEGDGWKTWGVELNKAEICAALKKGYQVFNEHLEKVHFSEKFNAISLWDVFEHIKDGNKYLRLMKNLLAPIGVLFLQVPNFQSLASRALQEKCNMFDGLEDEDTLHKNLLGYKLQVVLRGK